MMSVATIRDDTDGDVSRHLFPNPETTRDGTILAFLVIMVVVCCVGGRKMHECWKTNSYHEEPTVLVMSRFRSRPRCRQELRPRQVEIEMEGEDRNQKVMVSSAEQQ